VSRLANPASPHRLAAGSAADKLMADLRIMLQLAGRPQVSAWVPGGRQPSMPPGSPARD
jgi:hypothetical protein